MSTAELETRRARVLLLSALQIHPPRSGGNLRTFGLATSLAHHGHEVFVYSLVGRKKDYLSRRPSSTQTWPDGVQEFVDRGLLGFLVGYGSFALSLPPIWSTAYLRAAAASPRELGLPRLLRRKLAWCDAVLADFPFLHPVFAAPSAKGLLRVLSTHNIEHHTLGGEGWSERWIREMVRRIELRAAGACDVLVTCSASDQRFFQEHVRVPRSILVPNGIDVRRFLGARVHREAVRESLGIPDGVRIFLFTASMWGPNREAFDYLVAFARSHADLLLEQGIYLLVVGSVVRNPVRLPGFTATGSVEQVEPYFGAADAALNVVVSGAGTNVKMCDFIAARLPVVTTQFGARGYRIEDGLTGFVFEREALASTLTRVRRLFDEDPARLRRIAEAAYTANETAIDMDVCVRPLAQAISSTARGPAPPDVP